MNRSVPVVCRRTPAPRTNSWTIVPTTKPLSAKHRPELQTRMPSDRVSTPAATPEAIGHLNWCHITDTDDERQASSGPMPVSSSRMSPTGVIQVLKNGGPTVRRSPVMASVRVGNIVAKSTNSAENSSTQLLARNAASFDAQESSSLRALRSGRR